MSGQYSDKDDVRVKYDDGSITGVLVTGTTVGSRKAIDVNIANSPTVTVDERVFIYLQTNKLYSVGVDTSMTSSGTDNPLLYFRNPSGSNKTVYVFGIKVGVTITNVQAEFKVFHTPTVTANGTTVTPSVRNVGNSQPVASSLVTSLPTVSANGTQFNNINVGQNNNSMPILDGHFTIALQPNTSLLVTGNPSSNNRNASITVLWAEV